MKKFLSRLLIVLCFTAITAGLASAGPVRQVYLKDGAIIDCQKVWQEKGKVMVQVNRDVLLDFTSAEVNLKKTFAQKGTSEKRKKKVIKHTRRSTSKVKAAGKAIQKSVPSAAPASQTLAAKKTTPTPPAKSAPVASKATVPTKTPLPKAIPAPKATVPTKTAPPAPRVLQSAAATTMAKQAVLSSAKMTAVSKQLAPRPAIKYVPPPPPPAPEPFYKNPMLLQAGGGGLLVILLLVLLVMRKKKA